jgi:TolB-like protein/Flp pilus assembly protein TadD
VAVLPFDNLSADPEHAYFAVGIHEEILNRLAKIKSLSVTSRTSVLRYTSDRPPIPEIARTLNVETVMEGSVRYAGDRIQVAVQLIDAATDSHIWSETYPGDVSDLDAIFALQADIAMNVANALRAEFTPAQIAGIARPPTDSPEAYEFFLAAGDAADEAGGGESLRRALELIEEAITLDGNFAEAWARKSSVHSSLVNFGPLDRRAAEQEEAERAALRAIELDANSAVAYLEYGFALSQRGKPVESEHAFRKAEDLGGGTAVGSYGILLLSAGNFTKALAVFEGFRALNPLSPDAGAFLLLAYGFEGNIGAMKEEYQRGLALYGAWAVGDAFMVWLLLGNGDTAAAKEILARSQIGPSATIDTAVRENFDTPSEAVARLRELSVDPVNENLPALVTIAMWAAHFGDAQLALDVMERQVTANSQAAYLFWYPQMRDVRRSPRFKEIMRNAGFVDYWNEFGWPETCRPTVGDDFECD